MDLKAELVEAESRLAEGQEAEGRGSARGGASIVVV